MLVGTTSQSYLFSNLSTFCFKSVVGFGFYMKYSSCWIVHVSFSHRKVCAEDWLLIAQDVFDLCRDVFDL